MSSTPRETANDTDLSGRQLGDYRLLRRLGRGGMADVYLAEQMSLQRQVAFKVLRADLARDENYVKRFHREAQAAAKLVHANIVQIYEVGETEGVHFIAQEYVQGKNLREYLDRHGALDVRLAVVILRQMAAALFRAAQHGIVHRDIKPENVLIAGTGEVKVADFGLARVIREGQELNLTQAGVTLGTPLYMSPEQAEGKPLDHRSDLYSLGVTCYHMLAGQPPFRGETALSVAVQHIKSQAESLEKIRPDLPDGLCRIVHRLLEKKPANRYESAKDLLREVRMLPVPGLEELGPDDELWQVLGAEWSGPLEATRRLDTVMKTVAMDLKRPRRRWLWAAAGLAGAVLLGGMASWLTRGKPLLNENEAAQIEIPRQKDVQAQFIYAGLFNTKPHWLSVVHYDRADDFYARLAKKELALLYLRDFDYDAAEDIFEEMADVEESEKDLRTFGLAGLCILDSARGHHAEAIAKLQDLQPQLSRGSLDSRMRDALGAAARHSYRATDKKWEEWLDTAFGPDAEEDSASGPGGKVDAPRQGKPAPDANQKARLFERTPRKSA